MKREKGKSVGRKTFREYAEHMFLRLYAAALPLFLVLDGLWLGFFAKDFYRKQIGGLMKDDVNWIAAAVFYLLFLAGLVVFVITPAVEKKDWIQAAWSGAFFGLVCYATYDLTNLAVAKDWTLAVTLVDLAWGTAIGAAVSAITCAIAAKMAW